MSTILDALRKVEEEKRAQEADVHTRLFSTASSRFDFRTRRRSRMPWLVSGGLIVVGVTLGVGIMMWRTSNPVTGVVTVTPAITKPDSQPQVANVTPQQPETQGQPPAKITPAQPKATGPESASDRDRHTPSPVQPKVSRANDPTPPVPQPNAATGLSLGVGEASSAYDAWHGGDPQAAIVDNSSGRRGSAPSQAEDVVQRSPFVNSSPSDRTVAPSPTPPSSAPRIVATPKAPVQRPPAAEERRAKASSAPALRNDTTQSVTRPRSASSVTSTQGDPVGAPPGASLSFLQWSADPEKRVASIKVGTGPATLAHEGDAVEGMTIEKIRPDAVELRSGNSRYLLKAR